MWTPRVWGCGRQEPSEVNSEDLGFFLSCPGRKWVPGVRAGLRGKPQPSTWMENHRDPPLLLPGVPITAWHLVRRACVRCSVIVSFCQEELLRVGGYISGVPCCVPNTQQA